MARIHQALQKNYGILALAPNAGSTATATQANPPNVAPTPPESVNVKEPSEDEYWSDNVGRSNLVSVNRCTP